MHCNLKNTLLYGHDTLMNKRETNHYTEHIPDKRLNCGFALKIFYLAHQK